MKIINPSINILSEYTKDNERVKCECSTCGHIWNPIASNILRGKGCSNCHFEKLSRIKRKTTEQFICEMKSINPQILITGEYLGASKHISCKCLIHNIDFKMSPNHLLHNKTGCIECVRIKNHLSGNKTHELFVKELSEVDDSIILLDEYYNSHSSAKVKCKICGNIWTVPRVGNLLMGLYKCKICYCKPHSNGENKISEYLKSHNIDYDIHKTFDGLYGVKGGKLSYDFYIKNINLLIEYQGEQHSNSVEYFGGEKQLLKQKEHDERKRKYATENNYKLVEIWYYDYDCIDAILDDLFKNPVTTTAV